MSERKTQNERENKMNRNQAFQDILEWSGCAKTDRNRIDSFIDGFSANYARKVNAYLDRLEAVRNDPNKVITEEGVNGYTWAHINSKEGKAFLAAEAKKVADAEGYHEMLENIAETVADELSDKDSVSKVEIRQALDKYGKFSVENLNEVVGLLTEYEIEVK